MRQEKGTVSRRPGFSRKALIFIGLVVFVALDIILVALALGQGREGPRTEEVALPTQSMAPAEPHEDAAEDAEASPSPSPEADPARIAPRILSVASATVAWRSEGGVCDEPGALELTVDGGETWGAAYPSAGGIGQPLWVSGTDHTIVQAALASGSDCRAVGVRTYDSGSSWTQEDQVIANSVFIDPNDPSAVVWGGESIEGPCVDMIQVAVTGGVATALCGDGQLWSVASNSTDWTQPGVEDAVALSGSDGLWIAAVLSPDCDGLSLVQFNQEFVESLACIAADPDTSTTLDFSGNDLWLWVEDGVLVSTDLGRSLNG